MSNYTKTTDFEAKDSLPSGDSGKIIRGSEFETEFDNIATAIASKSDANNPTFTGTVTIDGLTVNGNTVLGNAASDTVTVTADIASNLLPSADDTYNLGAVGAEWNDLYVDGVAYIDTINGFAATGDVNFGDNNKAQFGAGNDLQIFHDGSNSRIKDNGTGGLYVQGSSFISLTNASATETYVYAAENGAVQLKYDNATKLATTATGIDVTGTASTDGLTVSGVAYIQSTTTPQLELAYNSANITGFYRSGGDFQIKNDNGAGTPETSIVLAEDGAVSLYHDASAKLATTSTGVDVTGTVTADGLTVDGNATISSAAPVLNLTETDTTNLNTLLESSSGNLNISTRSDDGGTKTKRMRITHSTGDISFYEDTGTTAKLFWDASAERLGLGTSSPSQDLEIFNGSTGAGIRLAATATAYWDIERDPTSGHLTFTDDGAGTVLTVGQDGNVGIGTDSPSRDLSLNSNGTTTLQVTNDTVGTSTTDGFQIKHYTSGATQLWSYENNYMAFATNNAERVRIDSSGNLLVSNTEANPAQNNTTDAISLHNAGLLRASTTNAAAPLDLNVKSRDGNIATFRKDGSTVGSIGSFAGVVSYIALDPRTSGVNGAGLMGGSVSQTEGTIQPTNGAGAKDDDAINLGASSNRFKDLYLSGGAYLGGTAAANKLDDYEEGTFTATLTPETSGTITLNSSFDKLAYTKIGRVVTITGRIKVSAVSSPVGQYVRLSLPFAIGNDDEESERPTGTVTLQNAAQDIDKYCIHPTSGTISYIQIGRTDNFASNAAPDFSGNELLSIALTYIT